MGKILLVEDDNNLREIYGARLSAEGHEIVSARDGEEALAVAVKEKPDLIIADIMMPRISGFDMLDILRNAPETKNTKIIMMTALSQQEDKEHAEKLGADKYLVKSQVTLEDVAKIVRETLESIKNQPEKSEDSSKPNSPVSDVPPPKPASEESAPPTPEPEPSPTPTPTPTPIPEPTQNQTSGEQTAPELATAPGDDKSNDKDKIADSTEPKSSPISIKVTEPDSPSPGHDVGPDLTQALADEEKDAADISGSPSSNEPVVISPTKLPEAEEKAEDKKADTSAEESTDKVEETKSTASDGTANKRIVIKPINDLSKKPDLEALAAKEEASEKSSGDKPTSPDLSL